MHHVLLSVTKYFFNKQVTHEVTPDARWSLDFAPWDFLSASPPYAGSLPTCPRRGDVDPSKKRLLKLYKVITGIC